MSQDIGKLIQLCGGAKDVANKIGVSDQAVYIWSHRKKIPLKRLKRLRELFGGVFTKEVVEELAK